MQAALGRLNDLLCFAMRLMLPAVRTKLLEFDPFRGSPLILGLAVVAVLAFAALELNNFSWHRVPVFLL
jgi:hypothetical protein